jgi:hypothetical protein
MVLAVGGSILGAIIFFGIPWVIAKIICLDNDRMTKYCPKLSKWGSLLFGIIHSAVFTEKDVRDKKIIIPCFSNVFLDYETTGDVSKQLERIEIYELPISASVQFCLFGIKLIKSKPKRNNSRFSSVFYFTETPKDGTLVVEYV